MEQKLADNQIKCSNCGAILTYEPGSETLKCPYCGTENQIEIEQVDTEELLAKIPYEPFIANEDTTVLEEAKTVRCPTCGAETTFEANVVSGKCPFCDTPLILKDAINKKLVKPQIVVPFKITRKEATKKFKDWLKSKWFAPAKAKKYSQISEKMQGLYRPYWLFDTYTITHYTGERGIEYETTRTDSEGNTYTETEVRWTYVEGTITKQFTNYTMSASKTLEEVRDKIKIGWDYTQAQPFDERFLTGFKTETYQISVKEAFEDAKSLIEFRLKEDVRRDIGGDRQRIHSMDVQFKDIGFLLALLPLWISAYRYKNKVYRFVVNGQTGEVSGQYPVSWGKVMLVVLLALIVIAALVYFFMQS